MVGLQQSSPMMTSMHCHSSVPSHCTRLKQCPVIMSCRPFGRQSYGIYGLRGGKESKLGLSLDSGLKAPRISSNRRHGQRMQIRMAVETEFPLPNLDKFLWDDMKLPDLTGKTVLVTGGNSGIGWCCCMALAKKGAKVYLTSRDPEKGKAAAEAINEHLGSRNVVTMQLDVAQFECIREFVHEFLAKDERLDILINNAGIHLPGEWSDSPESSGQRTPEGFEVTLGTNYFGPMLLTELLLPKLKESAPARIVNLGSPGEQFSGGVYWDDLKGENKQESDMNVYGTSKIYLIMASKALNEKLKGTGVEVFAAHPGITDAPLYKKTDKSKPMGLNVAVTNAIGGQPTERGSSPILYAAAAEELNGKGGAFIGGPTGPFLPFSNLDQFKDRPTFTEEGKHLEDCVRLYEETLKIIQPSESPMPAMSGNPE